MSRRGLEVWRFSGDPAPLARDSIFKMFEMKRHVQIAMKYLHAGGVFP